MHPTISPSQNPIILFDGVCNLCSSAVQRVLLNDKKGIFYFASLQSPIGQALLKQHSLPQQYFNSFILIENGKAYTQSTAALKVAKKLSGFYPLLYPFMIVPAFIRNGVYDFIARHRYTWFGKKETCWMPRPEWKQRFLDQAS